MSTYPVDGRVGVGGIGAGSSAQPIHLPYLRDPAWDDPGPAHASALAL